MNADKESCAWKRFAKVATNLEVVHMEAKEAEMQCSRGIHQQVLRDLTLYTHKCKKISFKVVSEYIYSFNLSWNIRLEAYFICMNRHRAVSNWIVDLKTLKSTMIVLEAFLEEP